MYGSNNMKKSVVFNNQFTPKLGGQFELESGGQFAPEMMVNLHWKVVVNLTGFSTLTSKEFIKESENLNKLSLAYLTINKNSAYQNLLRIKKENIRKRNKKIFYSFYSQYVYF
jgi:hypothetical protein